MYRSSIELPIILLSLLSLFQGSLKLNTKPDTPKPPLSPPDVSGVFQLSLNLFHLYLLESGIVMTEKLSEPFKVGGLNPLHPSAPRWMIETYKKAKTNVSSRSIEQRIQNYKKNHDAILIRHRLRRKLASGLSGVSNST